MTKPNDILSAATKLFIEKGLKGTSIQSIADACGISKGAVYLHFKSKNDIILALHKDIEKDMLESVSEIMSDKSLAGIDLLKRHILNQFTEVLESKTLQQALLLDSGFQLSSELLMWIQECRHRWQHTQEGLLVKAFGEDSALWVMDLCMVLDGMVQEYSTYMMIENAQFDIDRLVNLIAYSMQGVEQSLRTLNVEPVTTKETLPGREEILAMSKERKQKEIGRIFLQLEEAVEELSLQGEERNTLDSTLAMLKQQIEDKEPNKVLIRALLAALRSHRSLKQIRQALALELDVELV